MNIVQWARYIVEFVFYILGCAAFARFLGAF